MTHEEASLVLGDYAQGRLAPARRAALDRHLGECAECRAWLEDWRLFGEAAGGPSRHPDAESLASWVADPARLDPAAWAEVEGHVAACRECARLVQHTAQALTEARGGLPARRASRWSRWLPALAAAVLVAVAGAVLWTSTAPRLPAGPVPYVALTGTVRGAEARLVLGAGDRLAILGLVLPADFGGRESEDLELELARAGVVLWRTPLDAAEVAEAVAGPRPLLVAMPAGRLSRGLLAVRLRDRRGAVVLDRALTVERRASD